MNETSVKQTASLAIVEKKQGSHNRPGGCVGIFFQLFDWNRRLAKKKLFPKKLLPPVRGKQGSKKFKGDEKMPTKLHLIADENSGGFPKKNGTRCSGNPEGKNDMKAPGLVARLMGLESMPAVQRDKHKKASVSDCKEKTMICNNGVDREGLHIEKGIVRPQKIQKTGTFDRRAVTRFGAEAFQIKGVLSKSKKNHHPKLASPLKSPKVPSTRSVSRTSRLIDAASRILEPGLQATSRSKNALTYSSSVRCSPNNVASTEGVEVVLPDLVQKPSYATDVSGHLVAQNACKNCGNLIAVADSRPNNDAHSFMSASSVSDFVDDPSIEIERSKPRTAIFGFPEQVRRDDTQRTGDQAGFLAAEEKFITKTTSCPVSTRKTASRGDQAQSLPGRQQCKPHKDEPVIVVVKHRNEAQNPILSDRDRMPPFAKASNLQSRRSSSAASAVSEVKDYVALNKNLSSRSRPRVAAKVDNSKIDMGRSTCNKSDDSLSVSMSPVRKRRSRSINGHTEIKAIASPSSGKQRDCKPEVVTKKEIRSNVQLVERNYVKSRTFNRAENNKASGNKDTDIVSFRFSSQLRQKRGVSVDSETRDQKDNTRSSAFVQKNLTMHENSQTTFSQSVSPINGDALGALLEQKLKELTSQEDDDLTTPGAQPKKSTAMILQELIAALTAEEPLSYDGCNINTEESLSAKSATQQISVGLPRDVNHYSPGSVLEASFSNDSWISSSFDGSFGQGLRSESMDGSCEHVQPLDHDADDCLDSGALFGRGRNCYSAVLVNLFDEVSDVLHSIKLARSGLAASKLNHVKGVMLNTELFLGHMFLHHSGGRKRSLVVHFFLDKLEPVATSAWSEYYDFMSWDDAKGRNWLRSFLFDCIIEFLDSKYVQFYNSGFKGWTRMLSHVDADMLLQDIVEEVKKWMNQCGVFDDEIIEWEMGKWTNNDTEAFEAGVEVEGDILQGLLEEITVDLWECGLGVGYL